MKFFLALLIGKIIAFVGKFTGKATNFPGEIALKICPDLMGRIRFAGKVIAVTGSNGKTTTANMIAYILTDNGYTVANNAKGSNLTGGVATTLLTAAKFSGKIKQDYVVLEVDERFSRLIFKYFSPDFLLVTNLFRDQLTRNGNVDVIIEKLHEAIKPSVRLVLNADDPISANLAPGNPRVYYGLGRTAASPQHSPNLTHDAKVCPKCLGRMGYDYYHYNHIGHFHCSACGYTNPDAAYFATGFEPATGAFKIDSIPVHTGYRSLFNLLNMTGAVAVCAEAGLDREKACASISRFVVGKERFDEFDVGGRKAVMILSKNQNPVSFDQSISYVCASDSPNGRTVIVFVNNINHTYNKDTTWLYDISFENLRDKVDHIICTGPRAYDLAVRLKLGMFDPAKVKVECDISKLKPVVGETRGDIFILTEIYDANSILEVIR